MARATAPWSSSRTASEYSPRGSGSTAVNFRQRETGGRDDGDWRDQQHEQADAVAPDEQEFLADGQPDRAQHCRLEKIR